MIAQQSPDGIELQPIQHRYLLVLAIPVYRDHQGVHWTDPLWARDLLLHLDYLADFSLASPCIVGNPPPDCVRIDDPRIRFVDLPARRKSTLGLPRTVATLWRSIGRAEVVHTGLGGWLPVALGNLATAISVLRGRFLLIIVESSPWRLLPGQPANWIKRLKAHMAEWVNRQCMARVNVAIFTQEQYRRELLPTRRNSQSTHIIHASWINAEDILSDEEAAATWSTKLPMSDDAHRLRLLFAGRLTAAKGVQVLTEALASLDQRGLRLILDIMGTGELLGHCQAAARSLQHVALNVLEPVPYGPAFFQTLRQYHGVVVPNLSDEQPRIVYDAYSQAVPVLASDTDGLRDCVEDKSTGWLCKPNDPKALSELMERAGAEQQSLKTLGVSGLRKARGLTHQQMHRQRWKLLQRELPPHRP